jgi:hypothetical protein
MDSRLTVVVLLLPLLPTITLASSNIVVLKNTIDPATTEHTRQYSAVSKRLVVV